MILRYRGSNVQIVLLRPKFRGKAEMTAPGAVPEVDAESSPTIFWISSSGDRAGAF